MKFILNKDVEMSETILNKILIKSQSELGRLEKLEKYYLNKNDILKRKMADCCKPNNKIANPYASYITDTLCGYFVGEPITYSSLDEEALDSLVQSLLYNDSADEDMELARTVSIYGRGYELFYIDDDGITRFTCFSPKEVIVVYDDSIEQEILYAIRKIPQFDIMTDTKSFKIEVYSKD